MNQYIRVLKRRWWLLVLGIILAGGAAFGISQHITPTYEASTTLLISQAPATSVSPDYTALLTSERLAQTYAELMRKRPVLQEVIANLHLDADADTLAGRVRVAIVRDTELIVLTVTDSNPQRAADIANEIVKVFSQQNRELQTSRYATSKQNLQQELSKIQIDMDHAQAQLDALKASTTPEEMAEHSRLQALLAQYHSSYTTLLDNFEKVRLAETQATDDLRVVEAAQPELTPTSPKKFRNTLLAAIVGGLVALGVMFLLEYFDLSVKSSQEVDGLIEASTLAAIPQIKGRGLSAKLITSMNTSSPITEAYRLLRTSIQFAAGDRPIRTIAFTSSGPLEGKSTTIANLAIAIAQTGKRVILVDTDLRRPALHKLFGQPNVCGVTTALVQPRGGITGDNFVPTGIDNLRLMPSGPLPHNPAELLGSERMVALIEELKAQADLVLFDSPPLLAVVDASLLARACDATVLVVLAASTRADALMRAKGRLSQCGANLLGVTLNRVSASYATYYDYYYYNKGARHQLQDNRQHSLNLPAIDRTNGQHINGAVGAVEIPDRTAETSNRSQDGMADAPLPRLTIRKRTRRIRR